MAVPNTILKLFFFLAVLLYFEGIVAQSTEKLNLDHRDVSLINNPGASTSSDQMVYMITDDFHQITGINKYAQILKDPSHHVKLEDITKPEAGLYFKTLNRDSIIEVNSDYWGRIAIRNGTNWKHDHLVLYFGKLSIMDVYIFNERDSLLSTQKTGKLVPASEKKIIVKNRLAKIPLSLAPGELKNIYFKIQNANGYLPDLDFQINEEGYDQSATFFPNGLPDGLFIGFLLAIILFNLIFLFTTRDITFFYQLIFVFTVLVFMLDNMNLICDLPFLRDHPSLLEPINFAAIILMNVSYLQFVVHFIQLDKVFPVWINRIKMLIALNLIFGLLIIAYYFFSLNEQLTDTAIAMVSAVQYLILLMLLYQLFVIRDKKSYFILVATLFLIGGVIFNGVCVAMGIGVSTYLSKFVVVGNVSFFFFGLAYRMKLLKDEEYEAIRLKESQELKNQLYANVTHEFRTPLTVIQGMAQQIESNLKFQEGSKVQQAVQLIKSNGKRLLDLVNTILDLAKLESGKMKLVLTKGDLIGFLRYTVLSFENYADSKKIYLQFLTELDALEMEFDKDKLQQIISNLISNAIKFTPGGGKIFFTVKKAEKNHRNYVQFEVRDTGEGIPQSEIGNIFNRFFQAEGSKHKLQGSGIGLALVKELVELMEGQISVESDPGSGTAFRIELPVQLKQLHAIASHDETSEINNFNSDEFVDQSMGDDEMVLIKSKQNLTTKYEVDESILFQEKPLLLIVDDNKDIIYYLQTLLENQYVIETAYNGKDGISLALEIIPDIIISDVLMPEKDGYELCEILKSDERTSHIPIVLLTAKADTASRVTGLKKAADAYLTKPFDEEELKVQLKNLLQIRKALQEHYQLAEIKSDSGSSENKIEDSFLLKLNAIIQDKMEDEDFGILQLCRAMQMSRTQLHRKITALTGKSTSIYLRFLRLQKAKQLLNNTQLNISEVAFAVGFSDPNYFTRTFVEEFGTTPSAFRSGV